MWVWWVGSIKQEVLHPVLYCMSVFCGWDTVSSPVVFSFRPCEQLKEPWSLKSFKAEVSEGKKKKKNWTRLKEDFVFWWSALPKRVSLGRQRETGWRVKGEPREFLEGLGEMWITASERSLLRLGSLIVATPWAILWLCCTQATKRGFLHLFIQFHAMSTPKWPPFPLQICPVSLCGWPSQSTLQKDRPLMDALFLACCCFLLDEKG